MESLIQTGALEVSPIKFVFSLAIAAKSGLGFASVVLIALAIYDLGKLSELRRLGEQATDIGIILNVLSGNGDPEVTRVIRDWASSRIKEIREAKKQVRQLRWKIPVFFALAFLCFIASAIIM